ncbi:MAG: cupin domain-containing protein [Polyangia bacterium]|jgi:quercetin dioxygenase-like cupin family protein
MQEKRLPVAGASTMVVVASMTIAALAFAGQASEGQMAAQAIERALQKHGADVHRCFERSLADRLDAAGKVEIEVEVGPAGRVAAARLLSHGQAAPSALSACVQKAAMGWTVDGIESGARVVLPFSFQAQMSQFVVKAEDVPERALGAASSAKAGLGPKRDAPFTVKVLADETNMRVQGISLTQLNIGPASRVAMHRHPRSGKVLYLLKGHARLLGPSGVTPVKLDEGMVAFVPAGYPHVIENMGRQSTAVFLQAFVPPGPERVYRDPTDARGRADFEVIRDSATARIPPEGNGNLAVVTASEVVAVPTLGGKGMGRALLDAKTTGREGVTVNLLEFAHGAELPRHDHGGLTEILYVVAGGGILRVGSEEYPFGSESVLHLPAGQPHTIRFIAVERSDKAEKPEKIAAVQFLASARATGGAPAAAAPTNPASKTRSMQTDSVP